LITGLNKLTSCLKMLVPMSAAPTLTTEVVAAADKISAVGTGTSTFVPGIVIEVVSVAGCGRSVGTASTADSCDGGSGGGISIAGTITAGIGGAFAG
jgi:uncharacterized protein YggE